MTFILYNFRAYKKRIGEPIRFLCDILFLFYFSLAENPVLLLYVVLLPA